MLTSEDIRKLIEVFATKEDLKEAVKDLSTKKDVNNLINSVDAYMKLGKRYYQKMTVLNLRVDRLEKWIHQVAEKVGIELKA